MENDETYFTQRYLTFQNETDERLKVWLLYGVSDDKGETKWTPAEPGIHGQAKVYEVGPRKSVTLKANGDKLAVERVRFWAESETGWQWRDYIEQDLWLVSEDNNGKRRYLASEIETFTHKFAPPDQPATLRERMIWVRNTAEMPLRVDGQVLCQAPDGQESWRAAAPTVVEPGKTVVLKGPDGWVLHGSRARLWAEDDAHHQFRWWSQTPDDTPVVGQTERSSPGRGEGEGSGAPPPLPAEPKQKAQTKEFVVGKNLDLKTTWRNGLFAETADQAFRLHIGGLLHAEAGWWNAPQDVMFGPGGVGPLNDGAFFRRARLHILGKMYEVIDWTMEVAFENRLPQFFNVYADFPNLPLIGTVRLGHFREPFGMDALTSYNNLTFLERALMQDPLVPFFNMGIMVTDTMLDQHFTLRRASFAATPTASTARTSATATMPARPASPPIPGTKRSAAPSISAWLTAIASCRGSTPRANP